ncbi:MAG: PAS domain-containing protein [Pseudomonadota bacterium]
MTCDLNSALGDALFLKVIGEDTDVILSMVRNSRDCFKLLSADGYLLFLNDHGLEVMEIDDRAVVLDAKWSSLWPKDQQDLIDQAVAKAALGSSVRFEARCPTAKGRESYWDVVITPVTNIEGEIVQLLAVSRDITHRIQLEEQLREREAELERLLLRERHKELYQTA